MSTPIIRAELETKLATWAAAQTPPIPIAYEGVPFIKPANFGMYIECFVVPAITFNPSVDGIRKRELGIFQIIVWNKDGLGSKAIEATATSIVNLFPLVPKTGLVSIEKTPDQGNAITDISGYRAVPVSIEYRLDS